MARRRFVFFFQAEDGIRDYKVTGVQTCALPISFVNGVKSNLVTISGAGTNVYLTADDGLEHVGHSSFFDLLPVSLSLITPASVTEGDPPVPAQVKIPVSFPQPVTVTLTSTVPSELTVP